MNIRFSLIALLCAFLTLIQSPNYAFASDPSSIDALPTQFDIDSAIFIDDSPQHIEGAKLAGIEAFLLEKNQDVFELPFFRS